MSRLETSEALARLLRIIPLVSSEPYGMQVSEIVERFDYPRSQLLKDFEQVIPFVGVAPFTPDVEIWAEVRDDWVSVERPHWFAEPLRLPNEEAARVLALCKAALELSGEADGDEPGPLLSAFVKLSDELGSAAADAIEVQLGTAEEQTLEVLSRAVEANRRLELSYYSSSRGETTRRLVDPLHVFSSGGHRYCTGWCHQTEQVRPFRLDRMLDARATGATFDPADHADAAAVDPSAFASGSDKPRAVLRVHPSARWMIEAGFPVEKLVEADDAIEATLVVASVPWLARLLLRLGPHGEVVHLDPELPADLRSEAAAGLLAVYR